MRWLLLGFVGVLAAFGIGAALLVLTTRPPDLWFYWEAGRRWPGIYTFRGLAEFELFRYPPASALIFAALSNIPLPIVQVAWFVTDIALLLRVPWANGLLVGFAPKPYIGLLALRGGPRGVVALAIAGVLILATTALDGWRYLDVLRLSAGTEHGTFEPVRLGMPLYLAWVAGWMGLAVVARRTWVSAACAAICSPVVHLACFSAAFMAFAAAIRSDSRDVPAGIRASLR